MGRFISSNIKVNFLLFWLPILICSCSSEYQKREEVELARGERRDTLFHSVYFGMKSDQYREHCAHMNRAGIFSEGPANSQVQLAISDLPHSAKFLFAPQFFNDQIYQVDAYVQYDAWSPWNRDLFSDSLQVHLKKLIKNWYGRDDFIVIEPTNSTKKAFVLIDANKRVTIFQENDVKVKIIFRDLLIKDSQLIDSKE
jgi:hypothetical protein